MPLRPALPQAVTDLPTGSLAQSVERRILTLSHVLTSGKPSFTSIWLTAGTTVTSLTFGSAATALAGGTHGWFALYDNALALIAQSANDTSITWAANTEKTYALTSPHTATRTGWFYAAVCVNATTPNNLAASVVGGFATMALPPVMGGAFTATGITSSAPATFTQHNLFINSAPYVRVS